MFDIREYRPHNKFDKHLNCDRWLHCNLLIDVLTVIREKCLLGQCMLVCLEINIYSVNVMTNVM